MAMPAPSGADGPAERLAGQPGVQRAPTRTLELFVVRGFLDPRQCAALAERIDARRRPSEIADDIGIANFRTSETCDLDSNDPVVAEVEQRIAELLGLSLGASEPLQAKEGGATRFRATGKTIQPEAGKLLAWNNLLPDGRPNPATLHQGMKVRKGTKYVLTKWFRQRGAD
jgi:prolyl 4-hydroxylase